MRPIISLVSGTYNRLPLLQAMIASFRRNTPVSYEIVLVDGGSSDGTIQWAKQQRDVRLIEHGSLKGAIIAFTEGAYAAQGKMVLLSNDDVEFFDGSILPAIIYLEDHPKCGGVAFADNRPIPPVYTHEHYKTLQMPAAVNGHLTYVTYAQVGLIRKWLGDSLGWWGGEHQEMLKPGLVYGGDNNLSAHIWKYGYSVDPLEPCKVKDTVIDDELRAINRDRGIQNRDSDYYYGQWPGEIKGPQLPDKPMLEQLDKRAARILHLPIYEPGWERNQKDPVCGKHGLVEALGRYKNKFGEPCIVMEYDYMHVHPADMRSQLVDLCQQFRPDLLLTQFQAHGMKDANGKLYPFADVLAEVKSRVGCTVVNWNGDQWRGGLTSPEIMTLLSFVDLQLVVNLDVADEYNARKVNWAYWQNSFEDPQGDLESQIADFERRNGRENPFNGYPESIPVVFLGMLRSERRNNLAAIVQKHGGRVYTPGDGYDTLYNFPKGKFIYNRAKLCVSDNEFPDCKGFVSNRLMQALGAGGAMVLQEHVEDLDETMGIVDGVHYIKFKGLEDLDRKIEFWLRPENEAQRAQIAANGAAFMHEHHSFDRRCEQLFELIKQKLQAGQQLAEWVNVRPKRADQDSTGLGYGQSGRRYEYVKGTPLMVHKSDVDYILRQHSGWEVSES